MNIPYDLPPELSAAVQSELERDETIRWCEQPVPEFFSGAAIGTFLFAIPLIAFMIFWMVMASGGGIAFSSFGIPFVLIGFAMLSSPIWMRRKMKNTVYMVTDRRAVVFEKGWNLKVTTYLPDQIQQMTRRERSNGLGDVIFASKAWRDSDGDRRTQELGFFNICNPKAVEQLIKRLSQES